jgi:hypothetical protein
VDLPFESFRIFGFIDDYGVATCRPGHENQEGFMHDIQRAYYSGYLRAHGMKAQVVFLPNGMVGSVFVASLRHNDNGMLNMSGLNAYLISLFGRDYRLPPFDFLPALYGDGIIQVLETIVPRYRGPVETSADGITRREVLDTFEARMNLRMSGCRQSVEHCFSQHKNLFRVFTCPLSRRRN